MRTISFLLLFTALFSCHRPDRTELNIEKLTCEYVVNPVNIDTPVPRFSWIITSDRKGNIQTSYRIIVAGNKKDVKSRKNILWDSGKRLSDTTLHVAYEGKPLKSNSDYFWKIFVWDKNGNQTESKIATFSTALLNKKE